MLFRSLYKDHLFCAGCQKFGSFASRSIGQWVAACKCAKCAVGFLFCYQYSFHRILWQRFDSVCFSSLVANGWGCGKCGRACYVFVPRRKRPSGRNRSEVPMSTHIGYTPCYGTLLFFSLVLMFQVIQFKTPPLSATISQFSTGIIFF